MLGRDGCLSGDTIGCLARVLVVLVIALAAYNLVTGALPEKLVIPGVAEWRLDGAQAVSETGTANDELAAPPDVNPSKVTGRTLGDIAVLLLLTLLLLIIIPLPIAFWGDFRTHVTDAQNKLRVAERNQRYAGGGQDFLAILMSGPAVAQQQDELADTLKELQSISKLMGVIGILSGIVIGVVAPLLLNATETWRLFLIILGASLLFPGAGAWLATRWREAGWAIGLLFFSIALTFIIRTLGIPFAFFSGLFKLLVLIILIAASVLLAMWIGDFQWDSELEEEIKEKPIVIVVTAVILILEFINAIFSLWKTVAK